MPALYGVHATAKILAQIVPVSLSLSGRGNFARLGTAFGSGATAFYFSHCNH